MKKIRWKISLKKAGVYITIITLFISLITIKGIASDSGKGVAIILYEDFEDGIFPPSGWNHIANNPNATWQLNETSHSGSYCAGCDYDENYTDIQDEWLITPPLDFMGYREFYLSFWWSHSYYWGVNPYDHYDLNVFISLDSGDSWLLLWNESLVDNFTSYEWIDTTMGAHIDLSEFYDETDMLIGFQYYGVDGSTTYLDDITIGPPGKSDLHCTGELPWTHIRPDTVLWFNFTVENIGEPGSLLDWEIVEYPSWGVWNFSILKGFNLTPEGDPVLVDVIVVTPEEMGEYTGVIKIVNTRNITDMHIIQVSLKTPLSKPLYRSPFLELLQRLLERFPAFEHLFSYFFLNYYRSIKK